MSKKPSASRGAFFVPCLESQRAFVSHDLPWEISSSLKESLAQQRTDDMKRSRFSEGNPS